MQLPVSAPSTTFLAASGSLESESTETEGEENLVTRLLPEKRSAERMGPAGLEGFRGQVWKKIAEHEGVIRLHMGVRSSAHDIVNGIRDNRSVSDSAGGAGDTRGPTASGPHRSEIFKQTPQSGL